jgi:FtsH-binding integral membrane protein
MITIACTLYAFTTKNDFTYGRGMIWVLAMALLMLVLFSTIFAMEGDTFAYNCIIALCVVLLGFFLIHDTQLIVGKGKWRLGLDDYIVGALIIYVDIITIFLYLLALFGKK